MKSPLELAREVLQITESGRFWFDGTSAAHVANAAPILARELIRYREAHEKNGDSYFQLIEQIKDYEAALEQYAKASEDSPHKPQVAIAALKKWGKR